MNVADLPPVLNAQEAADVLRISKWSLYQAIQRGDLRVVRLGRSIRVPRAALAELLGDGAWVSEPVPNAGAAPDTARLSEGGSCGPQGGR